MSKAKPVLEHPAIAAAAKSTQIKPEKRLIRSI